MMRTKSSTSGCLSFRRGSTASCTKIERTWPVQTKVMMEETILSTYDVFQDSFTCQQRSPASCTKREERCLRSDFSKAGINKGNPATPWIMKSQSQEYMLVPVSAVKAVRRPSTKKVSIRKTPRSTCSQSSASNCTNFAILGV